MAILARAKNRNVQGLVARQDTAVRWKQQYAFNFIAGDLSTANVYQSATTDLQMPAALPRPAGRPKVNRYKSSMERAAGRRPAGADAQPRKVYNCKKCGKPKRGHVCTGTPVRAAAGPP